MGSLYQPKYRGADGELKRTGTVRLERGTTKNREGRVFYMTPELRATLEAQRQMTDALQRKTGAHHPLGIPPHEARTAAQWLPQGVAVGVHAGQRTGTNPP